MRDPFILGVIILLYWIKRFPEFRGDIISSLFPIKDLSDGKSMLFYDNNFIGYVPEPAYTFNYNS